MNLYNKDMKIVNIDDIKNSLTDKKVVLFGASTRNDTVIKDILNNIKIEFICDSNPDKWGTYFENILIVSPEELKDDMVVFTVLYDIKEIKEKMREKNIKEYYFYNKVCKECLDIFNKDNEFDDIRYRKKSNKKIKYLHVMNVSNFVVQTYYLIKEKFNSDEHMFMVFVWEGNDKYKYIKTLNEMDNVCLVGNVWNLKAEYIIKRVEFLFEEADSVIIHSSYFEENLLKFVAQYNDKVTCLWWGGEYKSDINRVDSFFKKIKLSIAHNYAVEKVEKWELKNILNSKLTYAYFSEQWKKEIINYKKQDNKIRILVGHSAHKENCQKEAFDKLRKFSNENIEIICPLSYGYKEYAEEIEKIGYEYFGDKFVPLMEYMDKGEYYKLLMKIDIVVFPMIWQAGVTGLTICSYYGKKIYLKNKIKYDLKEVGIEAVDFESLDDIDFNEFINMEKYKADIDKMNKLLDCKEVIGSWKALFEVSSMDKRDIDFSDKDFLVQLQEKYADME